MNKKIISIILIIIVLLGITYFVNSKNSTVNEPVATTTASVLYTDNDFGFTFALPDTWKGYMIVKNNWEGNPLTATATKQTGPKYLIRNPKWTPTLPYQDIPVMIFTLAQWNSYTAEDFAVSAAPIPATELARNNLYVFALPPRWNFDYGEGFAEAENIVNSKPLRAFDIQSATSGRLNIDAICEGSLAYTTFQDGASAEKYVAECKEGKHPEVIEKFKKDMNLGDGANI